MHEWLLAVGGVGLLAVMLLDWFATPGEVGELGVDGDVLRFSTDDGRRSAWQAFSSIDLVLAATVVATLAITVLAVRNARGDRIRAVAGVVLGLSLASTVLVGVRLLLAPPSLGLAPNVAVSATAWAWLGWLACWLLLVGGALSLRASRQDVAMSVPDPGCEAGDP